MTKTPKMITVFLLSSAWALALIATAIFLKGNAIEEWVQAFLYLGALMVLLSQGRQLTCKR